MTLVQSLSRQGGAEHVALNIATRLDPERFQSTLCVSRWPPPAGEAAVRPELEALADAGVRVLLMSRRGHRDAGEWRRLASFLKRERVHVLHAHMFGSNVWGTVVGRSARVPVVVAHEHSWSYVGQPVRRLLDKHLVARGADRFVAVSAADQRRMVEVEGIAPERTLLIHNGIPPAPPASDRDVRAELGIPADAPVIGAVGGLRPEKAYAVLLEAARSLTGEWPALQVVMVGDGSERPALEALARTLGVGDRVRFLGARADVPDILRAFDIAVCCSDREGTPLSVMEYMDAGLPVVGTAVGGLPDLVEDGVHGLLVPPRDPAALAQAVADLLRDPARRREMGARAHERIRTEYDVDLMVRRVERLYAELLERRGIRVARSAAPV